MTLADHLRAAARSSWAWGTNDCCTFPAAWVKTWGLGDPMARWRGHYDSEDAALRFVADAGGLDELWSVGMSDIGAGLTADPEEGDVGVVRVLGINGPEQVGAIHTGKRWAVLAPVGLIVTHAEFTAAWARPRG